MPPVKEVSIGFLHHCALAVDGGVWCWGYNPLGELGDGTSEANRELQEVESLDQASVVATGVNNSCAVQVFGGLMCWGSYDPTQNLALGEPWDGVLNSVPAAQIFGVAAKLVEPVSIVRAAENVHADVFAI